LSCQSENNIITTQKEFQISADTYRLALALCPLTSDVLPCKVIQTKPEDRFFCTATLPFGYLQLITNFNKNLFSISLGCYVRNFD